MPRSFAICGIRHKLGGGPPGPRGTPPSRLLPARIPGLPHATGRRGRRPRTRGPPPNLRQAFGIRKTMRPSAGRPPSPAPPFPAKPCCQTEESRRHATAPNTPAGSILAAVCALCVLGWQALTVRYTYGGRWAGLFYIGEFFKAPAALKSPNDFVGQNSFGYPSGRTAPSMPPTFWWRPDLSSWAYTGSASLRSLAVIPSRSGALFSPSRNFDLD